jgi:predicted NBD/HSP70 family sugar kinase
MQNKHTGADRARGVETPRTLAIDIGGTKTRIGVVSTDGRIFQKKTFSTPEGGEPRALQTLLATCANEFAAKHSMRDVAGVAIPGIWDRSTAVMQRALNLRELEGRNLRELFESALNRSVVIETDVNAAALAQYAAFCHAESQTSPRFAYLSIGTGVGGAIIVNSELVQHTRGGAGHLGHLIVDTSAEAPPCKCGARGCLETCIGGGALRTGELARGAAALAIALHQIAVIYAPDVIALSGGVIEAFPDLIAAVSDRFRSAAGTLNSPQMRIMRAPVPSDDAGVIGAALLARVENDRQIPASKAKS